MTNKNKEREDKALPNYVSLATRQELHDSALKEQGETIEEVKSLLLSLHKYHGNPENEKGWLEMIYKLGLQDHELNLCRKKKEDKRYSTSFKITMYTLALATGLAITEFFSGVPVFSTFWESGKGLFL